MLLRMLFSRFLPHDKVSPFLPLSRLNGFDQGSKPRQVIFYIIISLIKLHCLSNNLASISTNKIHFDRQKKIREVLLGQDHIQIDVGVYLRIKAFCNDVTDG